MSFSLVTSPPLFGRTLARSFVSQNGPERKEPELKTVAAVLLVGTGSPMTQAVVCRTLSVEATYPMSAKSTAPKTFILDGAGRRYLIPQDKEQAFDAWTAAVEKQELEKYIETGGETFERYKLTENHVQNFALLKTFYGSTTN
jgi:hypothetical protein